jgi:hypothetical protein
VTSTNHLHFLCSFSSKEDLKFIADNPFGNWQKVARNMIKCCWYVSVLLFFSFLFLIKKEKKITGVCVSAVAYLIVSF